MMTISAAELQSQFGRYSREAQREPVAVTHYGQESVVLVSAAEYKRLKALDNREVFSAGHIPVDMVEEIKKAKPPEWTKDLDRLMDP